MMTFCQPCRIWVGQHPKAARRVAFFIGMAIFFTILGWLTDPVYLPGMCKVYP